MQIQGWWSMPLRSLSGQLRNNLLYYDSFPQSLGTGAWSSREMHASPFCLGTPPLLVGLVGWDRDTPLKDQRTLSTEFFNRWQQLRLPFQEVKEPSPRDTLLIISCYRWRRLGWPRSVLKCTEHAHIPGGCKHTSVL